jgi:DNA-binding LytR/AlgR family response regulator
MTTQGQTLAGCRILIAENEYILAYELVRVLRKHGATIIGPVATVTKAEEQVEQGSFDVAALDINMQDEMIYAVAGELRRRKVPFLFVTGYDGWAVPATFADVPVLEKPCNHAALVCHIEALWPARDRAVEQSG